MSWFRNRATACFELHYLHTPSPARRGTIAGYCNIKICGAPGTEIDRKQVGTLLAVTDCAAKWQRGLGWQD